MYIKKAANLADGESPIEETEEKKSKQIRPRYERPPSIYNWKKEEVTLETPIPIKPVQILAEPKRENLQKQVALIDEKFEAVKTARVRQTSKYWSERSDVSFSNFTEYQGQRDRKPRQVHEGRGQWKSWPASHSAQGAKRNPKDSEIRSRHRIGWAQPQARLFWQHRKDYSITFSYVSFIRLLKQEKRVLDLQSKVKGARNEEDLRNELEDLQYRQQNEKLTNNEEKKLVAKIEELKLSLPFVM